LRRQAPIKKRAKSQDIDIEAFACADSPARAG
jgi:hypothetical protein